MSVPVSRPAARLTPTAALLGLLLLVLVPPLPAQRPLSTAFQAGTHVFRRILFDMQMTAVKEIGDEPQHTILIIHGDPRSEVKGLTQFLQNGGAVLFASDQVVSNDDLRKELRELTGCQISGRTVLVQPDNPEKPTNCYRSGQCPILLPQPRATPDLFRVAGDVGGPLQVATNRPSQLELFQKRPGSITRLADLPATSYFEDSVDERGLHFPHQNLNKSQLAFAVGGDVGPGRLLLLADHSLFINAMMMPADNSNVEFTVNCLDYLRGPKKNRDQVLFLNEGKTESTFDIPLKDMPELSEKVIRALLATLDSQLAKLEDQDAFNRTILGWMSHNRITTAKIVAAVIVALSLLLLAYLCLRLLRARGYRSEPGVPLTVPAGPAPAEPALLEQRQQELLRTGTVWESARRLARQLFLSAGVQPGANPRRLPRLRIRGGWWQRWQRSSRIRWLWRLAFDPRPKRVRPNDWLALMGELEQLRADLASGTVQVLPRHQSRFHKPQAPARTPQAPSASAG